MSKFDSISESSYRNAIVNQNPSPTQSYTQSHILAPPPYRSAYSSIQEDTGFWAADSEAPSYNSGMSTGEKRRSSWTNVIGDGEDNKYRSGYTKFTNTASPTANSTLISSTGSPDSSKNGSAYSIPQKTILNAQSLNGSVVYVNTPNKQQTTSPYKHQQLMASRQNSLASSGVVSDFFSASKGSSYLKFSESGAANPPLNMAGSHVPHLAAPPVPAGRLSSSLSGSANPLPPLRSVTVASPIRAVPAASSPTRNKRNRMEELRACWQKPLSKVCCLITTLLLLGLLVLVFVFWEPLFLPRHLRFSWQAPELFRNGEERPNLIQMDVAHEQARFELSGNMPFRSNYITVMDFKTNKVAIIDSTLRMNNKNFACFFMDLDRNGLKDLANLQKAARNSADRHSQKLGWQEAWNFIPNPSSNNVNIGTNYFQPEIPECRGARWIQLSPVSANQKPMKCTDCYDFCLPEYGIEHDYIRDEVYLNIVRRDCFYMFVPEWRGYAQQTGVGGPQQNKEMIEEYYQRQNPYQQQQQQQNSQFYPGQQQQNGQGFVGQVNQGVNNLAGQIGNAANQFTNNPTLQKVGSAIGDQLESRWISLQTAPQQIANFSQEAMRNLQTNVNQFKNQLTNQFPNFNNNENNNNRNGDSNNMFAQPPNGGFSLPQQQQSFSPTSQLSVNSQFSHPSLGHPSNNNNNNNNNGQFGSLAGIGNGGAVMGPPFNSPQSMGQPFNQQQGNPQIFGRDISSQNNQNTPPPPLSQLLNQQSSNNNFNSQQQQNYPPNQFGPPQQFPHDTGTFYSNSDGTQAFGVDLSQQRGRNQQQQQNSDPRFSQQSWSPTNG